MKIIDNILAKFGIDKISHHAYGADICAIVTLIGIISTGEFGCKSLVYVAIASVVVFIISVVKEPFDKQFDWMDVRMSVGNSCSFYRYFN